MLQRAALAVLFMAALLAGCLGNNNPAASGAHAMTGATALVPGPALWDDPQNTPHPKWHWPTLSHPAINGTVPTWWTPIAAKPLPAHIGGLTHVSQAVGLDGKAIPAGAGIAIFGHIAVVPEDSKLAHFVDISDPTHPVEVGQIESSGRGAAIIAYPDGRLVTAISTTPGFDVIEFTDPANPVMLAQVTPTEHGHKLGVVPGTPILYNAGSRGGTTTPLYGPGPCNVDVTQCVGYTSIYNLTDPANPVLVQEFHNGLSCHHIFFWNAPDGSKQRAICAGLQYTQLWDTADPEHPKVIVSVPVHSGEANTPSAMLSIAAFSHTAGLNMDGTILYVGDENMGGGAPPGCLVGTETPAGEAGTPIGATWFYDVSNEKSPRLLGYYAPPRDATHSVSRSCTTHHGRLVPDPEGRDLLAMSYYNDGVILLDFTPSGPEGAKVVVPKSIGEYHDAADTWETWYDNGYLFTGDLARGLDVIGFS
jgi:hypothetical protein